MEQRTIGMAEKKATTRKTAVRKRAAEAGRPAEPGAGRSADVGAALRRPARAKPKPAARLPTPVAGVVRAALDKKAEDLVVLDLRAAGGFTDFFVICTGANTRQIAALADSVRETLKKEFGERPVLAEGIDGSEWVLLDYFDFVVHIFSRDCRAFYGLERLWGNAERHEFNEPEARTPAGRVPRRGPGGASTEP
jgi:ribosome-associated protein